MSGKSVLDGGLFFMGSGISEVDGAGRVLLPAFVRDALTGRGADGGRLVFGAHDRDPCLIGLDPAHVATRHAEQAVFDGDGRATLPPLLRRLGRIGGLALFVGTGAVFEIWDPSLAREAGGEDLAWLAEYRRAESNGRNGHGIDMHPDRP
jgi:MraZ protein